MQKRIKSRKSRRTRIKRKTHQKNRKVKIRKTCRRNYQRGG